MLNSIDAMPDTRNKSQFNKMNANTSIIYSENNYSGVRAQIDKKGETTDATVLKNKFLHFYLV